MFQAHAASLAVIHRSGSEIPGVLRDLWRLAGSTAARRRSAREADPTSLRALAEDLASDRNPG